jgi:hypothetical protein
MELSAHQRTRGSARTVPSRPSSSHARWLTPTTRQETSQTVEGTGYRHLEAQRPDCWVTINPLRRQLVSFLPRLSSKPLPQLLTNRFVRVTCSLI